MLRACVLIAAPLLSFGCSDEGRKGSGLDCFPQEAARWLAAAGPVDRFAGRQDPSGPVTVYLDGSGSMAGYVRGATSTERPFHDLVGTLPDMLDSQATRVDFRLFGSHIREIPAEERRKMLDPGFFSCRGVAPADCDNTETRLDLVLKEVAGREGDLAVVVTDMWYADPGNVTSGLAPLAQPLTSILADGRTIAVLGIPSPFDGMVYHWFSRPGHGIFEAAGAVAFRVSVQRHAKRYDSAINLHAKSGRECAAGSAAAQFRWRSQDRARGCFGCCRGRSHTAVQH
jgi:hypothetical protein